MQPSLNGGQAGLIEQVIAPGLCVGCGACVGLCPYQEYKDGRIVVIDRCHAENSRCYLICPQCAGGTEKPGGVQEEISVPDGIGPCLEIHMARGTDDEITAGGQYGGMVSSLLVRSLESGVVDNVVLTTKGGSEAPAGTLARSREEILACAGSRYNSAGTLAAMNRAYGNGVTRMAVVGLPCQMIALERLAKMQPDGAERSRAVELKLGLFCTWALDYRSLRHFLKSEGIDAPARKYDIPPPPAARFDVDTLQGMRHFPLDEIRPAIQKGCRICRDMTAEYADISIGAAEGYPGWNTVLVRTETGRRLFADSCAANLVEVRPLPEANLEHLAEAARNKRRRGEEALSEIRGGRS
ncbi:Coenzyme F420 hydrogenase/dehydrogenase, beta subunit C-terminal domain [Desulfatiglans anilini]|uniref:Coenzyme F420 hydrogenase/dehydrogenase, beta subunit C-terminal domain n=1 Tax=Desulfatiglans anilini TaxID=90728 RepID=UPI000414C7D7|nr:Coenzyme F420 hydrogenase/dehydrogenase, beta subunit C-terminal domain [Desulfatiglans anilini]